MTIPQKISCVLASVTGLLMLNGCGSSAVREADGLQIKSLSNRADLLSGGDVLLQILVPQGSTASELRVDVDGRDVSSAFAKRTDGRVTGVVTGLKTGKNLVIARLGRSGAQLELTNHPVGGPIFAGPQVQPWVCATPTAQPASATAPATNASGLPTEAVDAQCNIATGYKFFYRTTAPCSPGARSSSPCFKPYDPSAPVPADLAETTNDAGVTTKYIVRVERGTLDRGIYDLAVLFDPSQQWNVHAPQAGWNRKLLWTFGGGSGTSHRQSQPNSTWQLDYALARGFMVAASSLTDHGLNSNMVVASEVVMMAKEHITETYGELRYTLGTGCSGGSIMQLQMTSLYPGLLDGLQPSCTYPDSYSTSIEVTECAMLGTYFASPQFAAQTQGLTPQQISMKKAAIAGHLDDKACPAWVNSFGNSNNPGNYSNARGQRTNNCQLLETQVYDPQKNPKGVRCSTPEYAIAVWGRMPGTDIARRIADNVGVQYGLKAFEQGVIGAEEFVTLNERIGGLDLDTNRIDARTEADREGLRIAYEVGLVSNAKHWAKTPIIDLRGNDNSNIHMNWRAFAVRDRLDKANGGHGNQVIWRFGPGLAAPAQLTLEALIVMDEWVSSIKADHSAVPLEQKVLMHKPAAAIDFCYIGSDYKTKIMDRKVCDADPVLRYYASPRQTAGGPLSEDILKCQLKPLKRSDYRNSLNDAQWGRLRKTFATGVCDWSKPGVGMQDSIPWQTFAAGPGGKPLPAAPRSKRL